MALDTPPKLRRKQNLAFALETTTGTPATLNAAAGVTNVFNPNVEYPTEAVERQAQGNLSQIAQGLGARAATVTFETELVGSTDGTAPAWTNLLLACGCQVNTAVWTPLTGQIQTATLGLYIDGRFRLISGCQGNVIVKLKRGQQVRLAWTFKGVQQPTTDTAIITPTYITTPVAPRCGSSFTFDSIAQRVADIEFDLGNEVILREDIGAVDSAGDPTGYRNAFITQRKPMMTFAPEALPISTVDLASLHNTEALVPMSLTIGSATHNTFTLAAPKLQIVEYPGIGDRQGMYVENVKAMPTRNTSLGDDEWSLTLA